MYDRRCDPVKTIRLPAPGGLAAAAVRSSAIRRSDFCSQSTLMPNEVSVALLYCGVGSADIALARRAREGMSTLVGQEIVGRVQATGQGVTRYAVGDIVGVGSMAASCGKCECCLGNLEQYCKEGAISTRDYQARHPNRALSQSPTPSVVVTQGFLIRIPRQADLSTTAPLLGAGVASYSAMQHWKLAAGQRVGIIGMGGLGHMAVKLAAARNAHVTVFTTSARKLTDARAFGADEVVLWNDEAAFERLAGQFDLLLSTVPHAYSVGDFMGLLKLDATLVNMGTTEDLHDAFGPGAARGRRSVATSWGAGIAQTQAVVNHCVTHDVRPEIELIRADQLPRLLEAAPRTQQRYRYVIDFASMPHH